MTDVQFLNVEADRDAASTLAGLFLDAGHEVAGAEAAEPGAVSVIVWSHSSIRSRAFLDAAQRAASRGGGVLACLIEPPPVNSLSGVAVFDLTAWSGRPDDPILDAFFFTVDRMAREARAEPEPEPVRPAAPQPQAPTAPRADLPYGRPRTASPEPPVRAGPVSQTRRVQPAPPAPPPQPPPAQTAAAHIDPLAAEAAHWKSIRTSENPADFEAHIDLFGPQGAFAELAAQRIRALRAATPASRPRAAPPAPTPPSYPRPEPRPEPRSEPRPSPRAEPAAPSRAAAGRPAPAEPRRAPPSETVRPKEPRRNNNAVLWIALIAIAGALFAVVFFTQSGSDGVLQSADTAGVEEAGAPAAPDDDGELSPSVALNDANGDPIGADEIAGATLSEAAPPPAAAPQRTPPAAATTREPEQRPQPRPRETQPERVELWNPEPQMPPPQLEATRPPPLVEAPLAAPATPQPLRLPGEIRWTGHPSASRMAQVYPERARSASQGGTVQLQCVVSATLAAQCTVVSEDPRGWGFGAAAIRAVAGLRAQPQLSDGASAVGARQSLTIVFALE